MTHRRGTAWSVATLLLALVAGAVATAAPSRAQDRCDGVWVVVDATALGGDVTTRCAPGDPATGLEALRAAGHSYAFVPRQPGLVCTIDARPDPCNGAPEDAYWSYWHAPAGGSWTYSNRGAGNRDPAPGTAEGWAFGAGDPPRRQPPSAAAPAPAEPTPEATEPAADEPAADEPDREEPAPVAPRTDAEADGDAGDTVTDGPGDEATAAPSPAASPVAPAPAASPGPTVAPSPSPTGSPRAAASPSPFAGELDVPADGRPIGFLVGSTIVALLIAAATYRARRRDDPGR